MFPHIELIRKACKPTKWKLLLSYSLPSIYLLFNLIQYAIDPSLATLFGRSNNTGSFISYLLFEGLFYIAYVIEIYLFLSFLHLLYQTFKSKSKKH